PPRRRAPRVPARPRAGPDRRPLAVALGRGALPAAALPRAEGRRCADARAARTARGDAVPVDARRPRRRRGPRGCVPRAVGAAAGVELVRALRLLAAAALLVLAVLAAL